MLLIPILYGSYIAPLPGEEPTVSMVVVEDMSAPNASIPKVMGSSVDWTDNANGLYDDVSGLLNPAPVAELIGLQPSYLRFPADHLSQVYDWTNGVGNRNERGYNPTGEEKPQLSLFGTDEFYKLVEQTGSDAVMVTNAYQGDADLARDWVSYCNDPSYLRWGVERAANGYPTPYEIIHWEIGYEPYIPRYWEGLPSDKDAGVAYAERMKGFSEEMKAIDPNIKIGAWMVLDPDIEQYSADQSWNINFLNNAGGLFQPPGSSDDVPYYDYVVVKVDLPAITDLLGYRDLYSYSYGHVYRNLLDDLGQLRGLLEANVQRNVPIAIASFGPFFGEEGWNTQYPANAGSGLITNFARREPRELGGYQNTVEYLCYGELNTPSYPALMINPEFEAAFTGTWDRSPNYLAFQMCLRLQGGRPLSVTVVDPLTFDLEAAGNLDSSKNVPLISTVASSDLEGTTIVMVLINRDLDMSIRCRINVDMPTMIGPVRAQTRTMLFESMLSNNLATERVTAPLRVASDIKTYFPDEIYVTVPPSTIVTLTLNQMGVS
jgi:hypothetical protein